MRLVSIRRADFNNPYKTAAMVVWLAGYGTTLAFILALGVSLLAALPVALMAQWILTLLQKMLWGRDGDTDLFLGFISLMVDAFLNYGGCMAVLKRLHLTPSYQQLSQAAMNPDASKAVGGLFALLLSLAPERLWNYGERWERRRLAALEAEQDEVAEALGAGSGKKGAADG